MDPLTLIVGGVLALAFGMPITLHFLNRSDRAFKLRMRQMESQLSASSADEIREQLRELSARLEHLEARDEKVEALEEQVRFLDRLLTSGPAEGAGRPIDSI